MRMIKILAILPILLIPVFAGCNGGEDDGEISGPLPTFPEMPSRETESIAIDKTLVDLGTALDAGDVEAASQQFTPETQEGMKQWFSDHADILSGLAGSMVGATMANLSDEYGWQADGDRRRSAEATFTLEGRTFSIELEKVDGSWLVRTF